MNTSACIYLWMVEQKKKKQLKIFRIIPLKYKFLSAFWCRLANSFSFGTKQGYRHSNRAQRSYVEQSNWNLTVLPRSIGNSVNQNNTRIQSTKIRKLQNNTFFFSLHFRNISHCRRNVSRRKNTCLIHIPYAQWIREWAVIIWKSYYFYSHQVCRISICIV